MYRDAKEELKRLEDALLADQAQRTPASFDINIDDEDEPEEFQSTKPDKGTAYLTAVAITLAVAIIGVLLFWLVRYGSVFL